MDRHSESRDNCTPAPARTAVGEPRFGDFSSREGIERFWTHFLAKLKQRLEADGDMETAAIQQGVAREERSAETPLKRSSAGDRD